MPLNKETKANQTLEFGKWEVSLHDSVQSDGVEEFTDCLSAEG